MGDSTISHSDIEPGTMALIVGTIAAAVTASVAGLWQWIGGRKKNTTDAQTALMGGFASLLASVQSERDRLLTRLTECERRVEKLERLLIRNKIEVPEDNLNEAGYHR